MPRRSERCRLSWVETLDLGLRGSLAALEKEPSVRLRTQESALNSKPDKVDSKEGDFRGLKEGWRMKTCLRRKGKKESGRQNEG